MGFAEKTRKSLGPLRGTAAFNIDRKFRTVTEFAVPAGSAAPAAAAFLRLVGLEDNDHRHSYKERRQQNI